MDRESLRRRIRSRAIGALTSPRTRATRRWLAERRRRLRRAPHRILYFHEVDDPYSQLAAQVLAPLAERYDVVVEHHLVGPPPDDAAPERERLIAWARRDAADVAPGYGLAFPPPDGPPDVDDVQRATRLLGGAIASGTFALWAAEIGRALWLGDRPRLEEIAKEVPALDVGSARAAVEAGSALRARRGHYLGAMFHYAGEWYWGVDRLEHLERRLRDLGAARVGAPSEPIAPRPAPSREPLAGGERLTLEVYPSLRSPYTAIAMDRVLALPERLPVDLVLRPVLPMVMRGLPVNRAKQLYIVLDTKREAEEAGVAFGRLCDPVGRPVERGFSLFPWARECGRAGPYLAEFVRAAFAEGIDTGSDDGLRKVVERAGLSWDEATSHLDGEGWRDELEANREAMFAFGLWGVPSFRLLGRGDEPDYHTWGQDRLWRVEQEIRRRAGDASPAL